MRTDNSVLDRKELVVRKMLRESGVRTLTQYRKLARQSLAFLCYEVLGYKDMGKFHLDPDTGLLNIYEMALRKYQYILVLIARGHFKTSVFNVASAIQTVLNDQEKSVGIGSWKGDLAAKMTGMAFRQASSNDRLKAAFPEIFYDDPFSVRGIRFGRSAFEVRRKNFERDESTFEAFGIESQPIGKHYDVLHIDDIVNMKNATPEMLPKIASAFDLLPPLLVVPERDPIRVFGTRYAYGDLYGTLREDPDWFLIERSAVKPNTDYEPVFPERFSAEGLQKLERRMGTWWFSTQYLLEPVHPDDMTFRSEWFEKVARTKLPKMKNYYIGCDPGHTKGAKSDPTVIVVMGMGEDDCGYLVDIVVRRMTMFERLHTLVEKMRQYKPAMTVLETIGAAQDQIGPFQAEMRRRRVFFPTKIVKGYSARDTKQERIRGILAPPLEIGAIKFVEGIKVFDTQKAREYDAVDALINQALRFPMGHDDILDAMAMAVKEMPDLTPTEEIVYGEKVDSGYRSLLSLVMEDEMERKMNTVYVQ